jgi:hypothetical protein
MISIPRFSMMVSTLGAGPPGQSFEERLGSEIRVDLEINSGVHFRQKDTDDDTEVISEPP